MELIGAEILCSDEGPRIELIGAENLCSDEEPRIELVGAKSPKEPEESPKGQTQPETDPLPRIEVRHVGMPGGMKLEYIKE